MTGSLCCTAETGAILSINYTHIFKSQPKKKKKNVEIHRDRSETRLEVADVATTVPNDPTSWIHPQDRGSWPDLPDESSYCTASPERRRGRPRSLGRHLPL